MQTNLIYIGSTATPKLSQRFAEHQGCYRRWLRNETAYISSFEILKFDDCEIELVENYPCSDIYELQARENYFMRENRDIIVNRQKAYTGLSKQEYYRQYNIENVEKLKSNKKLYYIENSNLQKQYRIDNAEKLKQKINCGCGGKYTFQSKSCHFKTILHKSYLAAQNSNIAAETAPKVL